MKWLFKWIFRVVFLVIALVVVIIWSKDAILKSVVERQIRSQTGMDVNIGKFSVGILSPVVNIEKFKLYNPPEFGGTLFLDIPELHIEYDRFALTGRKLHLTLLRIKLAELVVVKNKAGRTNIASLQAAMPVARAGSRRGWAAPGIEFDSIDVLNFSFAKARYIDLKDPSQSREQNIGLDNQVLNNVKSEKDLEGLVVNVYLRSGGHIPGLPAPKIKLPSLRF